MAFVSSPVPLRTAARPRVTTPRAALQSPKLSRRALLAAAVAAVASAAGDVRGDTTASGLAYTSVKKGSGPAAVIGDLVGIRFKGAYKGVVFDNLFENRDPYFYRVGSENILKVRHQHHARRGRRSC